MQVIDIYDISSLCSTFDHIGTTYRFIEAIIKYLSLLEGGIPAYKGSSRQTGDATDTLELTI